MDKNAINNNIESKQQEDARIEKTPDEKGGIFLQGHLKIFDPETKEVYVNGRA